MLPLHACLRNLAIVTACGHAGNTLPGRIHSFCLPHIAMWLGRIRHRFQSIRLLPSPRPLRGVVRHFRRRTSTIFTSDRFATEQSGKLLYLRKVFENNSRQSVWARANTDFRLGQPCPALQQHVTDQRCTSVKMTDMQDDGANQATVTNPRTKQSRSAFSEASARETRHIIATATQVHMHR